MKLTVVRLHPTDWGRLKEIGDGHSPNPDASIAVCAFDDRSEIVGRIFAVSPAHIEGVFIDEAYRSGDVLARLVDTLEDELRKEGITTALAFAVNEQMEDYIQRLGYTRSNVTLWTKELA